MPAEINHLTVKLTTLWQSKKRDPRSDVILIQEAFALALITATDRTLSIAEGMGTERASSKLAIAPALPGLVSSRNTVGRTRKTEPTK